ncbi:MAG: NTP transferase domain-containing protein [Nitrospirales bacterium]
MTRTIAIIQARMTSTRLPGKVLLPLAGIPLIDQVLRRLTCCRLLDGICVAIPEGQTQSLLKAHLNSRVDIKVETGPEENVLERTLKAAEVTKATIIVRVTSDCPFIEPAVVDAVIAARQSGGFDYARTAMTSGFPLGFDCEVFTIDSLRMAKKEARDHYELEHVTPFIWRRPDRFSTLILDHKPDRRHWRLVVDTQEDYQLASNVYNLLYRKNPDFRYADLIKLFRTKPELLDLNQCVEQVPYVFGCQDRNS